MGKNNGKKNPNDGRYLTHCAEKTLRVEHKNGGSHAIIYAPVDRGYMSVPQRSLGKGLACAIRKWLISAGVVFSLLFILIKL